MAAITEGKVSGRNARLFCGSNFSHIIFVGEGSAEILEGVLVVTGAATAKIQNNILVVTGASAAEISDGILTIS